MKRIILILVILFPAIPVYAFDKVAHHIVLYRVVIDAGLPPEEAELIANASQSLDENDSTTAFSFGKIPSEAMDLTRGAMDWKLAKTFRNLPHMKNGQVFHAMTSPENRQIIEQYHLRRIQQLSTNPTAVGTREQTRRRELLYLGQYLHFVADEVVHPDNPLIGHAMEGTKPDHVDTDAHKLRTMMALMRHKLVKFKAGELPMTHPSQLKNPIAPLSTKLEKVASAVENAWRPEFCNEIGKMWDNRSFDFFHVYDTEHYANAAARVGRAVGGDYIPFRKIAMDQNGDPIETAENRARFGSIRSIEILPMTSMLDHNEALVSERNATIARLAQTGFQKVTEAGATGVRTQTKMWLPPSSPGGIALDPGLALPDEIGEIIRVTFDKRRVILVTESGRYPVPHVNPRMMATVLRTVAAGQVPYLSIGTETSDRKGYARVTYAPMLQGTREGAIMFRADIQFKAIFGGLPFGRDYALNVEGDKIATGFPGPGGEALLMWITASQIELELKDGALLTTESGHGMRILGETTLMNDIVSDPTLDAYAEKLTDNWRKLTEKVWEFEAVEQIALATALTFYIRNHKIPTDPVLLSLPPKEDHTPDYVPLLAMEGEHRGVTGGVALTPEEKAMTTGRSFLFFNSPMFLPQPGPNGEEDVRPRWLRNRWLFIPLCLVALVVVGIATGLPAWVIVCLGIGRVAGYTPLRSFLVKVWLRALLTQGLLSIVALPIISAGWLPSFDRDFAALLVTWIAGPAALLIWSQVYRGSKGWWYLFRKSRALLTAYGLVIPMTTAVMAMVSALLTVSVMGVVPGHTGEFILTCELAPVNLAGNAVAVAGWTAKGEFIVLPVRSLTQASRGRFTHYAQPEEMGDGEVLKRPRPERLAMPLDEPIMPFDEPTRPFEALYRVRWPEGMPVPQGTRYYSTDGSPP